MKTLSTQKWYLPNAVAINFTMLGLLTGAPGVAATVIADANQQDVSQTLVQPGLGFLDN